jgi:hypothetical protein
VKARLIEDGGAAASDAEQFFRSPSFLEAEAATHTLAIEGTEELRLPLMKKKKAANRDGLCIMRLGVFGIGTSIHQVPFLHAHPNGR